MNITDTEIGACQPSNGNIYKNNKIPALCDKTCTVVPNYRIYIRNSISNFAIGITAQ